MNEIKEIISKEAIDGINKANDALIKLEDSIARINKKIMLTNYQLDKTLIKSLKL